MDVEDIKKTEKNLITDASYVIMFVYIAGVIKSNRLTTACLVFFREPQGKKPVGLPGLRREINIYMDIKDAGSRCVNRFQLA